MRKRVSPPRRFAAIENEAIDTLPSVLAVGLLTCLIRAKDGDDVTVATLSSQYEEGETSLMKAMRYLVEGAYVVKFKVQRSTTAAEVEDGKNVVKRGGSWYTTFTVDSRPFSREDVAAMVAEIYAEGNVKAHRVEPTRLDPRHTGTAATRTQKPEKNAATPPAASENDAATPPAPRNAGVGPTSNDAMPEVDSEAATPSRPTPASADPGRPTPGEGGAHTRKKTTYAHTRSSEDETFAPSARSANDPRRGTTGSRGVREGGSAASGKKRSRLSKAEYEAVKAVRALLPPDLEKALPVKTPPNVAAGIVEALAAGTPMERTPEQLVAHRVVRRWDGYWASRFYAGDLSRGPKKTPSVVGPFLAMLEAQQECGSLTCEDRHDFALDQPCQACEMRTADKRADRGGAKEHPDVEAPVPKLPQQATVPWQDCAGCERPYRAATPGRCSDCPVDAVGAHQSAAAPF